MKKSILLIATAVAIGTLVWFTGLTHGNSKPSSAVKNADLSSSQSADKAPNPTKNYSKNDADISIEGEEAGFKYKLHENGQVELACTDQLTNTFRSADSSVSADMYTNYQKLIGANKVKKVYVVPCGQKALCEFICLMKDGNLKVLDLEKYQAQGICFSKDVKAISHVESIEARNVKDEGSGYMGVFALTEDGQEKEITMEVNTY